MSAGHKPFYMAVRQKEQYNMMRNEGAVKGVVVNCIYDIDDPDNVGPAVAVDSAWPKGFVEKVKDIMDEEKRGEKGSDKAGGNGAKDESGLGGGIRMGR